MASGFGVGGDPFAFGSSFGVFLRDPRFPRLPGGGIFTGEGNGTDVRVGDASNTGSFRGKQFENGIMIAGIPIEHIAFQPFAGRQFNRHVASIVERQFNGFDKLGWRSGNKPAAFE